MKEEISKKKRRKSNGSTQKVNKYKNNTKFAKSLVKIFNMDEIELNLLNSPTEDWNTSTSDSNILITPSKSESDMNSSFDYTKDDAFDNFNDSFASPSTCYDDITPSSHHSALEEFIDEDSSDESSVVIYSAKSSLQKSTKQKRIEASSDYDLHSPLKVRKRSKELSNKGVKTKTSDNLSSSEENCEQKAQYHYTNDGTVVIIKENDTIYFHGLFTLSVLHGEVEVLGHILNKNSPEVKLYSLRGSSLLYVRNITKSSVNISSFLSYLNISSLDTTSNSAILLCKKLEDANILFVEKHMSQQILPKADSTNLPRVVFEPKGVWNVIKINPNWNFAIDLITTKTKMLICGGKGVGKSTFLRYTINRLLMKFKKIRVVDLDPGQSEFTLPGCISSFTVTGPLFGVNYTHLQRPDKAIISNIDVGHEPLHYIHSLKYLLHNDSEEMPTLFNFMGFTHGIGLYILSAAIAAVQPTDVVQINSNNIKKNYKFSLKPECVCENARFFLRENAKGLFYNLLIMESMTDRNNGWTAQARQLREMCILSYLSQMTHSNSIFNTNLPLYRCNLSDIVISNLAGKVIHPAAVNGNLIALCSVIEPRDCIFECYGWAIVRGVDLNSNILVLLTPESTTILEKTTHLVLTSVTLPPSIYMTPDEVVGEMPYVIQGDLMSFGQIPKRTHLPAKV